MCSNNSGDFRRYGNNIPNAQGMEQRANHGANRHNNLIAYDRATTIFAVGAEVQAVPCVNFRLDTMTHGMASLILVAAIQQHRRLYQPLRIGIIPIRYWRIQRRLCAFEGSRTSRTANRSNNIVVSKLRIYQRGSCDLDGVRSPIASLRL